MAPKRRKAKGDVEELRAKSEVDLASELEETYRQLFSVRLKLSTRQLTNVSEARRVRHRIARIKSIQRERELAAAYAAVEKGSPP